jgi:hypothetical protein
MVRVVGGYAALEKVLVELKKAIYKYNSVVSRLGYYLKPVHKVYRRGIEGRVKVFEYYGRYWWRVARGPRGRRRLIYVGTEPPAGAPKPPKTPLLGIAIAREGDDVILDCDTYKRLSGVFKGYRVFYEA